MSKVTCFYVKTQFSKEGKPDDNGYRINVYRFKEGDDGGHVVPRGTFTATGQNLGSAYGACYILDGEWVKSKYGFQFKVSSFEERVSATEHGIVNFLQSLGGATPNTARKIYDAFGDDALRVLDKDITRLDDVKDLNPRRKKAITESYLAARTNKELFQFLNVYSIPTTAIGKLSNVLGSNAVDIVKADPFRMMTVEGIGYISCEKVRSDLGLPLNMTSRIVAGMNYVLQQNEANGNSFMDYRELIREAAAFLSINEATATDAITYMADDLAYVKNTNLIGRKVAAQTEKDIAERIHSLSRNSFDRIEGIEEKVQKWEADNKMTLHHEQKKAVISALSNGFSVITGGPGRGKTTIARCIVDIRRTYGKEKTVCLLAPTGKASKKLSEAGQEAHTIHSALRITDATKFANEKIRAATIIVDESSMLDVWVAKCLLDAVENGCQMVFIGDIDQLPSVGCGAVLRDIIESNTVPVVKLTAIYRQGKDSPIINAAEKIRVGDDSLDYTKDGFKLYRVYDFDTAARYIIALYRTAVQQYGRDQVIVLTPHHHAQTATSVDMLNKYLQYYENPASSANEIKVKDQALRIGDLVMQTKNREECANGDVGVIKDIYRDDDEWCVRVLFDKATVEYTGPDIKELELAYACSIHKSQGSEYACVIINLMKEHGIMLKRNLLYTAVTRAKQQCILVSNPEAISIAVKHEETNKRKTMLKQQLQHSFAA